MKTRYEKDGVHFYDRVAGTHILLDEVVVPQKKIHIGPRIISIALTNLCDSHCYFCYSPKTLESLGPDYVFDLCRAMDTIGVLEVAFGGGEPTLYPHLIDLCNNIWNSTNLGISITTNGNHLTKKLIDGLIGSISIIRFSIDATEPLYSQIRGHALSNVIKRISCLRNKIPYGINSVINSETVHYLDDILKLAVDSGAENLLLLPQIQNDQFVLDDLCWSRLENWINSNWRDFPLEISSIARSFINCPFLFDHECEPKLDYWHIGANGRIRMRSYCEGGTIIDDGYRLIKFFEQQNSHI